MRRTLRVGKVIGSELGRESGSGRGRSIWGRSLVAVLTCGVLLAGCSSADDDASGDATTSVTSEETGTASASATETATATATATEPVKTRPTNVAEPTKPAEMSSEDELLRVIVTGEYVIDLYVYMRLTGDTVAWDGITSMCDFCDEEAAFAKRDLDAGQWVEQTIEIQKSEAFDVLEGNVDFRVDYLVTRSEAKHFGPDGITRSEPSGDFTVILGLVDDGGLKVHTFDIRSPEFFGGKTSDK